MQNQLGETDEIVIVVLEIYEILYSEPGGD